MKNPNKHFKKTAFLSLVLLIILSTSVFAQKGPKDTFKFPKLNPIKMPKVKETTLKNGMRLFLVEDHNYPKINIRARIYTGSFYESAEKVGLASITGTVLRTGGTKTISGDEIDIELETMAASIFTSIGNNSGTINASMLKEDVDKCLSILADILMNPAFMEDKIELAKIQERTFISRRNDNIGQITSREFNKLIYGAESPYAHQTEYATIDAVTREDIIKFYNTYFHPNNIIVAVWGDFKTKEMIKKIENVFNNWKKQPVIMPDRPKLDYKYRYTVNYVDKSDVNQSNIMIGHIGGMMNYPDYPSLLVMNSILSRDRMLKKIRSDEGLALSVWGEYGANFGFPGVFSSGTQTKSKSTVYAIELMLNEIKRMTEEEVTDEELKKAKDQYLNSFVFQFDSKAKIITRMLNYTYFGYPLDFADKLKEKVEKVTKADVLRLAKKYLHPNKVQILVVGNKKDFDKPLSTLGNVNVIDITIPQPKGEEVPEATGESLAKGKEYFEKTMTAIGEIEKIKAVKNYKTEFEMTAVTPMSEMNMDGEVVVVYPDKIHFTINTPQGEMVLVVNGDKGVMKMMGRTMPMSANQIKSQKEGFKRETIYLIRNYESLKIQFIGSKQFAGQDAVDLLISLNENTYHMFLHPDTHLPLGISYQDIGQAGPVTKEDVYSDYREVDGIKIPFSTITYADGEKENESVFKSCLINVEVDEKLFVIE